MTSDTENPEISISTSLVADPSRSRSLRRQLTKLIITNTVILVACAIALFARIYTNAISARKKQQHDSWSYFVFEMIVLVLGILNAILGLTLAIYERGKQQKDQLESKLIIFNRFNYIHLVLNLCCSILFSLFFVIEFIRWCGDLLDETQVRNGVRLLVILLAIVITLCKTACALWNRILAWSPKYKFSRSVLFFSSTILIAISIASINFNGRVRHLQPGVEPGGGVPLWCYKTFQASSSYILFCGLIGVGLTFMYGRKDSGPNQFRNRLRLIFNILCTIGLLFVIVVTIILLAYHTKYVDKTKLPNVYTLIHANPVLSVVQAILLLLDIKSLHSLRRATRSGRNGLTVERIQLSQKSAAYMKHWAAAIDAFNNVPDGMTGDAALQLMRAYEDGQLENVDCVVLRIGRPGRRIPILNDHWDDTEALILFTIIHSYDTTVTEQFSGFWGTVLKRTLGSENCSKHFRPLLLRLGLIGYQWPFRTSIFFTAPHRDPLTRAALVLKTVIDWNEMQKSNMHCDVLLLPTFSTEPVAKAIYKAGFFPLPLPPTHLVDLRPHRGKTWNQYMKTLKKGNRRPYIQQFLNKGGIIEEVHDLNRREVGEAVCEQWANIARIRRDNKEPPTLAKPSVEFITSMGNNMIEPYRSVVFLRFNNEVIASSVIYKFPYKLLTTDIQGLTHEKARPLKAYFVMLQWVIREALDKKFDFVDFGPTTPGPKIDLGCVAVPLEAGGYAGNPILAFGIKQAGSDVDNIHKQREGQQQNVSQGDQIEKEQDEPQPDIAPRTENNVTMSQAASNVARPKNRPKKQKQVTDVAKSINVNSPQTNAPEASSVTTNNEIPSIPLPKKVNPPRNKGQTTPNARNQPRQNPRKKKSNPPKNKESNQETTEPQSLESIQPSDILPESSDSTVKEESPTDQTDPSETVIPVSSKTSTTIDISNPPIALSDSSISDNIKEEIKHDNSKFDFF